MMKILMRLGKDPFDIVPAFQAYRQNVLGYNNGNLLFQLSAYKSLNTPLNKIVSYGYSANPSDADWINDNFDCFVLPLANAFRKSFIKKLDLYTSLVKKLKIPVIVLGVGAQAEEAKLEKIPKIDESVTSFVKAVLDKSASIGVRGEFTASYLRSLGFGGDVIDVVGCPSMFLFGSRFPETRSASIGKYSKLVISSRKRNEEFKMLAQKSIRAYPNLHFLPQATETLEVLLGFRDETFLEELQDLPVPGVIETKFFIDIWPWMMFLKECEFAFGTRIHGNVISLLAGTPAHVVAHDSRTLELAEYFEIPYTEINKLKTSDTIETLYEKSDYSKIVKNHGERFNNYLSFMQKNGLQPDFSDEYNSYFRKKMASMPFPCPLGFNPRSNERVVIERLNDLDCRVRKIGKWMSKKGFDANKLN